MQLHYETFTEESINSPNSLWFRKTTHSFHVIYSKMFYIYDYFFFLTRNSPVTYNLLLYKSFDCDIDTFPLVHFNMATFLSCRIWFVGNYVIDRSDSKNWSIHFSLLNALQRLIQTYIFLFKKTFTILNFSNKFRPIICVTRATFSLRDIFCDQGTHVFLINNRILTLAPKIV